jgi:hypothetical protein
MNICYVRKNPNYPCQAQKWLVIHRATEEYVDYGETRQEARIRAREAANLTAPEKRE